MPVFDVRFYNIDPASFLGETGSSSTYTGPQIAAGVAAITDNGTGADGLGLDDDGAGEGATTAVVSLDGDTSTNAAVDAERVWTVQDTTTGEIFQIAQFDVESGDAQGLYTLSEVPLVVGHTYEVLNNDTYAVIADGEEAFTYADYQDGIVEGTSGNDTIDSSYVESNGGDVIDGETTTSNVFSWEDYAEDGVDLSGSDGSMVVGGIEISISYNDEGPGYSAAVSDNTIYTEAGEDFDTDSSLKLRGNNSNGNGSGSDTSTLIIDFDQADGSEMNSEVENVTFRISDIDVGRFVDTLTITASDDSGQPVTVLVTSAGDVSVAGDTATGVSSTSSADADGSILVTIAGPVSSIEIDYGNDGTGDQGVNISDIHFDSVYADYDDTVEAGDGDDFVESGLGDDVVSAGAGDDTVSGGDGDDILFGDQDTEPSTTTVGSNLITNGTMEATGTKVNGAVDTNVSGWTSILDGDIVSKSEVWNGSLDGVSNAVGDTYVELDNDKGVDAISQTIATTAGTSYVLSFDAALRNTGGDDGIEVYIDGELVDVIRPGDATWDTYTVEFTGTGDDTTIEFSEIASEDDKRGVLLDDVSVMEVSYVVDPDAVTDGDDIMDGGDGDDTIYGQGGDDTLNGGADNDFIDGGSGDDTIYGGTGEDTIYGGEGDDTIYAGSGDTIDGGDGDDTFIIDPSQLEGNANPINPDVITIIGSETGEDDGGDTLDMNGLMVPGSVVRDAGDDESGYATLTDGTIIRFENIETLICFGRGTRIETPYGPRRIETLKVGDLVITRDHGPQPLRWIGSRGVEAKGDFAPIQIKSGVLGNTADLIVSPQHRMVLDGWRAEMLFGANEVFAAAKHLINDTTIVRREGGFVEYFHMMFDAHEVVFAESAASESFHPSDLSLTGVADEAREELFKLFPELRTMPTGHGPTARLCLKAHEARLLMT